MSRHRSQLRLAGCFTLLACALASIAAAGQSPVTAPARFESGGPTLAGSADWVWFDADLAAFGSGEQVTVVFTQPTIRPRSSLTLDAPAVQGVVAGTSLFLVQRLEGIDRLAVVDLASEEPGALEVPVRPKPRSPLRLGQMGDYLLLAEDGYGVRILELPGHRHHGHGAHHLGALAQVGFFPLEEKITAVTASLRTIYVATDRGLTAIDASVPALPGFVRHVPLETGVHAMAANRSVVYLLSDDGLRLIDLSRMTDTSAAQVHGEVRGRSLYLAGRALYVADGDGGVRTLRDQSAPAITVVVLVGDSFFSPAGTININTGDTVEWQKPNTIQPHNVFSCNPTQMGCPGASSTETFTSGPITLSPFTFPHTFTIAGANPYLCQRHFSFMQGNIMVAAAPAAPPGVPDGAGASSPVTVGKLDASGTDLSIQYDTGCPGAAGHDIIYGVASQLPPVLGGIYGLTGGRCSIGTTSPFTWTSSPAPALGDFIWWVIVADNGVHTEGSWGKDIDGTERDGAGTNGSSLQCGNSDKDLSNLCGQ